jgi:MFS family permease
MARKSGNLEDTLHDQTQLLDKKNVIFVFALLSLCLLVCFIDQNGIGVILPPIARDLNAQASISWAGTSALIANTVLCVRDNEPILL